MTVELAVIERLAADAAVIALASGRIYEMYLPQSPTLPAIVVQLIDEPTQHHLRGRNNAARARVQVDGYVDEAADDPGGQRTALGEAIDAALDGQTFSIGTPAEIVITGAFRVDKRNLGENKDELRLLRVMQDYIVWSRAA